MLNSDRNGFVREFPLETGLPVVAVAIREPRAEQRLHHREGDRLYGIQYGATEFPEGLKNAICCGNIAAVARCDCRDGVAIRRVKERRISGQLVGGGLDMIAEVSDHVECGVTRVEEKAANNGVYRVCAELKRCDYAEVPTATAESPEEILMFRGARREDTPIRSDNLTREQVVD
jgi:hypothetical protein